MLTPSSHLLQKRQEAIEVHSAMKLQREDFEYSLCALQGRKDKLKQKEEHMKDFQQKFDNFLKHNYVFRLPLFLGSMQDNEAKRCRVMRKVNQERELTNQKQADLLALQEEMKSLVKERDKLMKRVEKNAIYLRFLDKVVQASPQSINNQASEAPSQFQEVRQLKSCYYSLKLMSEDLLQITQQNQESIEKSWAQLVHFTKQGNDTILHYNNTLSQLQSQLDKAREEGMIWESRWVHIQNTAAKKTLLLGTIKMATLNLYQSVCKRAKDTGDAPIAPEDTFQQLEKIQSFLSDLISMWEEVSRSHLLLPGHR
ncbi:coiled-coil domain-containing protein 42-like [Pygocentrus nattereri]|uniref:coiled-coil domain-containing protein 42-like n=1 Tax=Pygocentrus nattereri TaxID=42514 RepID=UPI001890FA17|nr:coiled-coil domain-containing protein 42-like [Pygocentrus nattereri]